MGCNLSVNVNNKGLEPVAQPVPSATGKNALASGSSGTNKEGSSLPVRLVVNATSNSEVSSNPILGDGLAGATIPARRRPTMDFYKGPVPPLNEVERMLAFTALDLSNKPSNPTTARLCHVLAKLLKMGCVNLHFIDEGVFHINTSQMAETYNASCTPDAMNRKMSLCGWTLLPEFPEVLIVPDLMQDMRFREHPIIKGEPHFRFYGGCPLVTFEGYRLGTVCMLDMAPRVLTVQDVNMLCNFAELAVRELEKQQVAEVVAKDGEDAVPDKVAASDFFSEGIMIVDTASSEGWPILWMNSVCSQLIGVSDEQVYAGQLGDFFQIVEKTEEAVKEQTEEVIAAIKEGSEITLAACKSKTCTKDGCLDSADLHFRPVTSDKVDENMPLIGIPSFIKPAASGSPPCTHYFVSIRRCSAAESEAIPEGQAEAEAAERAAVSKLHTTMTRSQPSASGSMEGVQLGQFIARRQTGRLFRGTYNDQPVVIKVIEQSGQGEQQCAEAALLAGLSHPNIVTTYKIASRTRTTGRSQLRRYKEKKQMVISEETEADAAKPKSQLLEFWLVREYCEKGNLSDAVERGWFMTEDSLVASAPAPDIFAVYATAHDIASAMAYLHSKAIIHGNLQGDCLGLAKSSQDQRGFVVKVTDFDVAVSAQDGPAPPSTSTPSFAHLAPEVITGQVVSKASDVYAFGVLLWELLSGEAAWNGLSHKDIAANVVTKKMQLAFPDYEPTPYKELALECMANSPEGRPSFEGIVARLEELRSSVQAGPGRAFLRDGFATSTATQPAAVSAAPLATAGAAAAEAAESDTAAGSGIAAAPESGIAAAPGSQAAAESEARSAPESEAAAESEARSAPVAEAAAESEATAASESKAAAAPESETVAESDTGTPKSAAVAASVTAGSEAAAPDSEAEPSAATEPEPAAAVEAELAADAEVDPAVSAGSEVDAPGSAKTES